MDKSGNENKRKANGDNSEDKNKKIKKCEPGAAGDPKVPNDVINCWNPFRSDEKDENPNGQQPPNPNSEANNANAHGSPGGDPHQPGPGRLPNRHTQTDHGFRLLRDIFGIPDDDRPPEKNDPTLNFSSCGGLEEQIQYIRTHLMFILANKTQLQEWGIEPVKGIIFHGPPGSGKTLLAKALANELAQVEGTPFSFFMRSGTELFGKYVGQTEGAIRSLFETAKEKKPAIIFLDELDGMAGSREEASPNAKFHNGVVTQLLACMDQVVRGEVIVIGATNRIESIDPAFRRPGRFDKTLAFYLPKSDARMTILKIHTKKWKNRPTDQDYESVSTITVGFTGADLEQLCREVFVVALYRQFPNASASTVCNIDSLQILLCDWRTAVSRMARSNSNVFGNMVYAGEVPNPEIRLLTTPIEEELSTHLQPFVREVNQSEAEIGTGIKSCLVWSNNPYTIHAVNSYVIPSFISSRDSSSTLTFKFDITVMTPKNRIEEFMSKIFEMKKNAILYVPDLDQMIIYASKLHLDKALATQFNTIRGKNILLLATTTRDISVLPDEYRQLFYGMGRTFQVRTMNAEENQKFFEPIFTLEFYENEQKCLSQSNSSTSFFANPSCSKSEKTDSTNFDQQLKTLLHSAIDLTKGNEIPDVLNLKAELIQSAKVKQTADQHVAAYEKVLDHYRGGKMGQNGGSGNHKHMYS